MAVVDDSLARQYWPGKNPVGQYIGFDHEKGPWYQIVGIVKHAKSSSLEADGNEGFYFFPMAQMPQTSASLMVRSSESPEGLRRSVAAAVQAVDPGISVYDVKLFSSVLTTRWWGVVSS